MEFRRICETADLFETEGDRTYSKLNVNFLSREVLTLSSLFQSLQRSVEYPQVDLAGVVFRKHLSYRLGFPWTGEGLRSECPGKPLVLSPLDPSSRRSNLALFMGTPDSAEAASAGKKTLDECNLAHSSSIALRDRYLAYLSRLLAVEGIDTSRSVLTGSGSAAVAGAIEMAHRVHERMQSGHLGIVCSTAAHPSVGSLRGIPVHRVPVDGNTGQLDAQILEQVLREKKPAAIVETVGTTDFAHIENIPEPLSRYCAQKGIIRIKDLTLASLFPLLNEKPINGADANPDVRDEYRKAVRPDSFDLLVCGTGKHYGVSGLAAILCNADAVAALGARPGQDSAGSYFDACPVYGTTTLGAGPLVQTVRTIERLGPWRLRYLAVQAVQTARTLANQLKRHGLVVAPVRINAVCIYLGKAEEVSRVQNDLASKYDVAVARISGAQPGIRLVLPLDRVLTEQTSEHVAGMVAAVIKRQPFLKLAVEQSRGSRYRVEQAHLQVLAQFFEDGAAIKPVKTDCMRSYTSPPVLLQSETYDLSDRLQSSLAIIQAQSLLPVAHLSRAFETFHSALCGVGGFSEVRNLTRKFGREVANSSEDPLKEYLCQVAEQLSQIAGWPARRSRREQLFQTLAAQVLERTDEFYAAWISSLRPVPRSDRLQEV